MQPFFSGHSDAGIYISVVQVNGTKEVTGCCSMR